MKRQRVKHFPYPIYQHHSFFISWSGKMLRKVIWHIFWKIETKWKTKRVRLLSFVDNYLGLKKAKHQKESFHTVSSQDFRSFCFLSFFLWKIMPLNFFCEIATFTSRLLLFDNFFLTGLDYWLFYEFNSNFLLEKLGKFWRGVNGFKFSKFHSKYTSTASGGVNSN